MPAPRPPQTTQQQPSTANSGWLDMLKEMFISHAVEKGAVPPAATSQTLPPPTDNATNAVAIPDPIKAQPVELHPAIPPAASQVPSPPPAQYSQNPQYQSMNPDGDASPQVNHVSAQEIADAGHVTPLDNSTPVSAIGKALSGIKVPQGQPQQSPSAPNIPGTHQIQGTLLDVLRAAGLQTPTANPGLHLFK